jgi:hypothetical protein
MEGRTSSSSACSRAAAACSSSVCPESLALSLEVKDAERGLEFGIRGEEISEEGEEEDRRFVVEEMDSAGMVSIEGIGREVMEIVDGKLMVVV